jgi:hypothetical protein
LDGLSQVRAAGFELHNVLLQFDALAQGAVRFHSLRTLEELGRAAEVNLSGPLLASVWAGLGQQLDTYGSELKSLRSQPLAWTLADALKSAEDALSVCRRSLGAVEPQTAPKGWLPRLTPQWEALERSLREFRQAHQEATQAYRQAPNLEALRDLIGRTLRGDYSPAQFRTRLESLTARHREIVNQEAEDEVVQELAQIGRSHAVAYACMDLYGEDSDPHHLLQGWQLIALTTPRLLELSIRLRERIGLKPPWATAAAVRCLHCGLDNPQCAKYCRSCRALLLNSSAAEHTEYTDITKGRADTQPTRSGPSNLLKLQDLAAKVEEGEIDLERFRAGVEEQIGNAQRVGQILERQLNKRHAPNLDLFFANFNQYSQGLVLLKSYRGRADTSTLQRGLGLCLSSGRELMSLQGQLRGGPR